MSVGKQACTPPIFLDSPACILVFRASLHFYPSISPHIDSCNPLVYVIIQHIDVWELCWFINYSHKTDRYIYNWPVQWKCWTPGEEALPHAQRLHTNVIILHALYIPSGVINLIFSSKLNAILNKCTSPSLFTITKCQSLQNKMTISVSV